MKPPRPTSMEIISAVEATSVVDTPMRKVEVLEELDGSVVVRAVEFRAGNRADVFAIHLQPHEAHTLGKVLFTLEPLAEKTAALTTEAPRKADVVFVVVDEKTPKGRRVGGECVLCREQGITTRFFDRLSKGKHPRVLESGIGMAIEHCNSVHKSTGGVFRGQGS